MSEQVECHSGYTYAERPAAFYWEGRRQEIRTIVAEWRTPKGRFFRVRAQNDALFELFYEEIGDQWRVQPA